MIKENLKIKVNNRDERDEAATLLRSLNTPNFAIQVGNIFQVGCDEYKEITLEELRDLARPKEYLDENYQLQVTNLPKEGWINVPEGAIAFTLFDGTFVFWRNHKKNTFACEIDNQWFKGAYSFNQYLEEMSGSKILWRREEQPMNKVVEEKKGRFLHQWAYEAFGRGEDVQIGGIHAFEYFDVGLNHSLSDFNNPAYKFRLKPRTITINGHVINAPIDVKLKASDKYFVASITHPNKWNAKVWMGNANDFMNLNLGIIHLTAENAAAHTNALLSFTEKK